jgi:hypothetical protein
MKSPKLQGPMRATYRTLRWGLPVLGLALPWLLWIGGRIAGLHLQGSMSAYYFTPMRDEFVGVLVAVGALLVLYRGYTELENWALNFGGVFLAGVAFFHMNPPGCGAACSSVNPHGVLALLFFACIAYVCIFRASDTLGLMVDATRAKRFKRAYRILGALMILSPVIAVILRYTLQAPTGGERSLIFFVEATGVYVFAVYWMVKSREIAITDSERKAMEGKLVVKPHGVRDVLRLHIPVTLGVAEGEERAD